MGNGLVMSKSSLIVVTGGSGRFGSVLKNYKSKTISNRMANIGEYNEFISFFVSDKAKYANGSCIVIDGGLTSIV